MSSLQQNARLVLTALITLAAWLAVGIGSGTPAAWANPNDIYGNGARGAAMGNAAVSNANDGSANYYNPALLANAEDTRIDLGYLYAQPNLKLSGGDVGVNSLHGGTVSLVVPGRIGKVRLAFGLTFFSPDNYLTRLQSARAARPRFFYYHNRPQRLFVSTGLGIAVTDKLSIGAGLMVMSQSDGIVKLEGLVAVPIPEQSDLNLDIDVDLKTIRYPHVGVAYQVNDWLRLGAAYRDKFTLRVSQVFRVNGDIGGPGLTPLVEDGYLELSTAFQDLFQPAQAVLGATVQASKRLSVALDLSYQRWGQFENPATQTKVELDVGQFNDQVNIPPPPPIDDPSFSDILAVRVGGEYVAPWGNKQVALRAGYAYEPSPAPEQTGSANFIDNNKHILSVGGGLELPGLGAIVPLPVAVDAFVQYTVLQSRLHQKISAADELGDFRSSGSVWAAGVTSKWRF